MEKEINIKVTKSGDKILNIMELFGLLNIAVEHKDKTVTIYRINLGNNGIPRIEGKWNIVAGNEEIEIKDTNSELKITTF